MRSHSAASFSVKSLVMCRSLLRYGAEDRAKTARKWSNLSRRRPLFILFRLQAGKGCLDVLCTNVLPPLGAADGESQKPRINGLRPVRHSKPGGPPRRTDLTVQVPCAQMPFRARLATSSANGRTIPKPARFLNQLQQLGQL